MGGLADPNRAGVRKRLLGPSRRAKGVVAKDARDAGGTTIHGRPTVVAIARTRGHMSGWRPVRTTAVIARAALLFALVAVGRGDAHASNWVVSDSVGNQIVLLADGAVSKVLKGYAANRVAVSNSLGLGYVGVALPYGTAAPLTVPIVIVDIAAGAVTGYVADPLGIAHWSYSNSMRLAASPDGTRIHYVSLFRDEDYEIVGVLGTIDALTSTVVSELQVPGGGFMSSVAFSPDGRLAYLGGVKTDIVIDDYVDGVNHPYSPGVVTIVSLETMSVVDVVFLPNGAAAWAVAITADGAQLYILSADRPHAYTPRYEQTAHVLVFDTASFEFRSLADFDHNDPVNGTPKVLTIAAGKVYVAHGFEACSSSYGVMVIDAPTGGILGSISISGSLNRAMGADLEGAQVYVSAQVDYSCSTGTGLGRTEISIIDTATDEVVGTVADPDHVIQNAGEAVDPIRPNRDPMRCVAAKRKAIGAATQKRLSCFAKAMKKSQLPDQRCLDQGTRALTGKFAKLGDACPGEIGDASGTVDTCSASLLADVPSGGACAAASTSALGRAMAAGCSAKEATKPGAFTKCGTKADAKLVAALAKAGGCAQPTAPADVDACRMSIFDAVPR